MGVASVVGAIGRTVRVAVGARAVAPPPGRSVGVLMRDTREVLSQSTWVPRLRENREMVQFRDVTSGLSAPEGPLAMRDGSVLVVETLAGRVTRVQPDGSHRTIAEPGGGPNGLALGPDGRCYVCNNGGLTLDDVAWLRVPEPETYERDVPPFAGRIEAIDLADGSVEVLYGEIEGEVLEAPNDLVFDTDGGFWFTDFGSLFHRGPRIGWVAYAVPDGSHARRVIGPLERPNGVGLSPDGSELYVAETMAGRVWTFEVTSPGHVKVGAGAGCGGRLLVERPIMFDSLAVEADGHVCVASPSSSAVARIDPRGGSLETIPTPHEAPTNICFGGPDLRTAYVTLHGGGGALVVGDWPGAGMRLPFAD